ncbi:hypothetical protein FB45DRAFT_1152847 [Roridomyces roridus]|uniref:Arrestin C-terminal-like domain-containing protein n=1 Tax=Roridomyces roridus TaxID=1738132 RepID=A0AAD7BUU2_9AGAR|nr:hypothetical protein FB45DRAFT_1152847 [Roridomyces roridus]
MSCQGSDILAGLSRHGTLLSAGASPVRRAAELKSLLGNANSRLPPGALITHRSREPTALEHAKPRARVEVDIALHSDVCVESSTPLRGIVKIRIRPRLPKESTVSISDGKLRIIGFEAIEGDHHEFFQCSALLSDVVTSPLTICETSSPPDSEGFAIAWEGVHRLEFEMPVPMGSGSRPKGPLLGQSGAAIRYIALISIKVKDQLNKRSIAHFYRDCEVWPRLNPSAILAPSAEQFPSATTSKALFMGGSGEVTLTARLHRSIFVAGTRLPVHVLVRNETTKIFKRLTLTLIRSITVFKREPETTRKSVATSTLEMVQGFPRGHASADGWWAGVRGGERSEFCHFLSIPPDALTHPRGRLVEVAYTVSVSLTAGITSSDVSVALPIQIVNLLSLDPPIILRMSPPTLPSPRSDQQAEFEDNRGDESYQYAEGDQTHEQEAELGNVSMCDDTEDLVQHAVMSARSQYVEDDTPGDGPEEIAGVDDDAESARSSRPCGPSSFATRVQQKLQEASASKRQSLAPIDLNAQNDELSSNENPAALDVPGSESAISSHSVYQVASSSFLNDCYFSPKLPATGSRLVPDPSPIVGLPFPEPDNIATAVFVSVPPASVQEPPPSSPSHESVSCYSEASAVKSRRPSLTPTPSSANSVKEKIRELEERVRLAEGY